MLYAVDCAKFCFYTFNHVVATWTKSTCPILKTLGKSPRGREFETH